MQKNPNFLSQLSENEQTPAKIWELLRHNQEFRSVVEKLRRLDAQAQNDRKMTGTYHGTAWEESCSLITKINDRHPFAGVALQWLVPEPLFYCSVAAWPRGKKWKNKAVVATRNLREGHGTTPNIRHKNWVWTKTDKPSVGGQPMTRGPRVHLTKSRFKALRSKVNPFQEWKNYAWPFTVEHSWRDAPAQFRREILFIWRRNFDYRSVNPITNNRSDTTMPHETKVVQEWELLHPPEFHLVCHGQETSPHQDHRSLPAVFHGEPNRRARDQRPAEEGPYLAFSRQRQIVAHGVRRAEAAAAYQAGQSHRHHRGGSH